MNCTTYSLVSCSAFIKIRNWIYQSRNIFHQWWLSKSILTYIVRAVIWPDSDFLLYLQSSEQATEDTSAYMKQSPTECVPSASEILHWQIVWCFFGVMKACKKMKRELCTEIPLLRGPGDMLCACKLKLLSAWQLALLGCWEGIRFPEEFSCLVKPCFPLLQASPRSHNQGARAVCDKSCTRANLCLGLAREQLAFGTTPLPSWGRKLCSAVLLPPRLWQKQPQKMHTILCPNSGFSGIGAIVMFGGSEFLLRCVTSIRVGIKLLFVLTLALK